jgi:hypothetical protein
MARMLSLNSLQKKYENILAVSHHTRLELIQQILTSDYKVTLDGMPGILEL